MKTTSDISDESVSDLMVRLWDLGFDTLDISKQLNQPESEVHKILMLRLSQRRELRNGYKNRVGSPAQC